MKKQDVKKINFRANPYRGIFAEIANEQNCTRQNIYQKVKKSNPQILQILTIKLNKRNKIIKNLTAEIEQC